MGARLETDESAEPIQDKDVESVGENSIRGLEGEHKMGADLRIDNHPIDTTKSSHKSRTDVTELPPSLAVSISIHGIAVWLDSRFNNFEQFRPFMCLFERAFVKINNIAMVAMGRAAIDLFTSDEGEYQLGIFRIFGKFVV
jgi:hypothetical protein